MYHLSIQIKYASRASFTENKYVKHTHKDLGQYPGYYIESNNFSLNPFLISSFVKKSRSRYVYIMIIVIIMWYV